MRLSNETAAYRDELSDAAAALVLADRPDLTERARLVRDLCAGIAGARLAEAPADLMFPPVDDVAPLIARLILRAVLAERIEPPPVDRAGTAERLRRLRKCRAAAEHLREALTEAGEDGLGRFPGPVPARPGASADPFGLAGLFDRFNYDGARNLPEVLATYIAQTRLAEAMAQRDTRGRSNEGTAALVQRLAGLEIPQSTIVIAVELMTGRNIDERQVRRYLETPDI